MTARIEVRPYRLALRHPWPSAHGPIAARAGWLVRARQGGVSGYGDCAPLPAAGTESAARARDRLDDWQAAAGRLDLATLLDALAPGATPAATSGMPCPAADCAVETALLDLSARLRGVTLRERLVADLAGRPPREEPRPARTWVAVNAMLGAAVAVDAAALDAALDAGFRVLKLKLGVAPVADELAAVARLAAHLGARSGGAAGGPSAGARLRLDANGAWDPPTAHRALAALADLPIDAIEEPLAGPDPDHAELATLQAGVPFALALDESLAGRFGSRTPGAALDPARLPVRRLVLKPGVVGGLRPTLRLARAARTAGREVVVTSLIESAAGLWATAQLAAAVDAATGTGLCHGLATGAWLVADLGVGPPVRAGGIDLADAAGSGFVPHAAAA